MHIHPYTHSTTTHIHTHTCTCTHTYTKTHTGTQAYTHRQTCIHIFPHTYVHIYKCVHSTHIYIWIWNLDLSKIMFTPPGRVDGLWHRCWLEEAAKLTWSWNVNYTHSRRLFLLYDMMDASKWVLAQNQDKKKHKALYSSMYIERKKRLTARME